LQELRAQKRPVEIYRRGGMIAALGLAAAAAIFGLISLAELAHGSAQPPSNKNHPALAAAGTSESSLASGDVLVPTKHRRIHFMPGALPIASEDGSSIRSACSGLPWARSAFP